MALLTAQQTTDLGTTIGYDAADENGDSVAVRPDLLVHIKNSAAADEIQGIAITGSPTGGTFTLELVGTGNGWSANETTGAINFNATAANVRTALEALNKIVSGDVVVNGGPLPDTPITVTFTGSEWGNQNVVPLSAVANLTGGTDPAVAVTTDSAGHGTAEVTFEAHEACNQGYFHSSAISIPPGEDVFVGPFGSHLVSNPGGLVNWTYGAATGISVAALLV